MKCAAATPPGLRARAVPVSAAMGGEAIDPAQRVAQFDKPDDVAFAVELENGSDEPIKLLVRPVRSVLSEWSACPRFEKRSREFVDPPR